MNEPETRWFRRIAAFGIIALFILVGVSIATYLYYWTTSPTIPTGTFRPFFPFGWLGGLFFIFIAFWLVKWMLFPWRWHYRGRYWRYGDSAYYILRERYARGEITKEQFDQMMRDLQQHSQS